MTNEFSVTTIKKTWKESFSFNNNDLEFKLVDFWSWNTSDLLNNAMRGKLAEYIIAKALWIDNSFRIEWDEFDLIYKDLKIEVKSGAYIQSWEQDKYSNIVLTIKPTQNYNSTGFKRQSDIYIFAILNHKDSKTINPMKLEQWDFYVIKTKILDENLWLQKTLWLNWLFDLNPIKATYIDLKRIVDTINV